MKKEHQQKFTINESRIQSQSKSENKDFYNFNPQDMPVPQDLNSNLELEAEIQDLRKKSIKQKYFIEELQTQINVLSERNTEIVQENSKLNLQMMKLKIDKDQYQKENQLQKQADEVKDKHQINKLTQQNLDLKQYNQKLKQDLEEAQKKILIQKEQIDQLNNGNHEHDKLKSEKDQISQKVLIHKQKFDDLQKANQDLKKEIKQLKRNSNYNQIEKVDQIQEIKKEVNEIESKLSLSFDEQKGIVSEVMRQRIKMEEMIGNEVLKHMLQFGIFAFYQFSMEYFWADGNRQSQYYRNNVYFFFYLLIVVLMTGYDFSIPDLTDLEDVFNPIPLDTSLVDSIIARYKAYFAKQFQDESNNQDKKDEGEQIQKQIEEEKVAEEDKNQDDKNSESSQDDDD